MTIKNQEELVEDPTVVEKSVPALLVDRKAKPGRVRTSNGQQILRTGPEENYRTRRALVVPEDGETIVLLGAPSVRLTQMRPYKSTPQLER